jgi:hypothetical protein
MEAVPSGSLRAGERLPPEVGDRQLGHLDRPPAGMVPGIAVASPPNTNRPKV